MKRPPTILNAQGFSMVSVLVAMGLAGILVLVVAQLGRNASTVTREAVKSSDIRGIEDRIYRYMTEEANCMETLGAGKVIAVGDKIQLNSIMTRHPVTLAPVEQFRVNEHLGSSRITLKPIEVERTSVDEMVMRLNFDKDGRKDASDNFIGKNIRKDFFLYARFDPSTDTLLACGMDVDPDDKKEEKFCTAIGFEWINDKCDDTKWRRKLKDEVSVETCESIGGEWDSDTETCAKDTQFKPRLEVTKTGEYSLQNERDSKEITVGEDEICQVTGAHGFNSKNDFYKMKRDENDARKYKLEVNASNNRVRVHYQCSKVSACDDSKKARWETYYGDTCVVDTTSSPGEGSGYVTVSHRCIPGDCGDKCKPEDKPTSTQKPCSCGDGTGSAELECAYY